MKQETAQVRQKNWNFAGLYVPVNGLYIEICERLCVFLCTFRLCDYIKYGLCRPDICKDQKNHVFSCTLRYEEI